MYGFMCSQRSDPMIAFLLPSFISYFSSSRGHWVQAGCGRQRHEQIQMLSKTAGQSPLRSPLPPVFPIMLLQVLPVSTQSMSPFLGGVYSTFQVQISKIRLPFSKAWPEVSSLHLQGPRMVSGHQLMHCLSLHQSQGPAWCTGQDTGLSEVGALPTPR